jgi:alpha-glucosidase
MIKPERTQIGTTRTLRILSLLCLLFSGVVNAGVYTVTSPDGTLQLKVDVSTEVSYEVACNGNQLIAPSIISLNLNNGITLAKNGTVKEVTTRSVNEMLHPLFGKNKEISDHYNELKISFTETYALIFRAYDEGVAYRFETAFGDNLIVNSEEANFNFTGSPKVIFPEADAAMQSWERAYTVFQSMDEIGATKFCITPALFSYAASGINVVIAESDLSDYPGMYLQRNANSGMKGLWAQYPKTVTEPDNVYAYHRVTERYDYLARTSGTRSYPWRVIIVSKDDRELLTNELIYKLARPQALSNTSWIKPGKSTWEWWHDAILEGVNIPSGTGKLSYQLYKYYVDFAAENKLEYLTMDAGWGADYVAQVCKYAASRNVKVILWDFINLPVVNPERLTQLKNYGAAGIKVDLIERDDQVAINWVEKLAKECADRELLLIVHGCPKPAGLQRMYPNILNFEAVRGEECDKWDDTSNPDYHLQFPFIRMLCGPLDYTPGSMRNVHRSQFSPVPQGIPQTMGSRSHELAMYVVFDQPLAYLCDSPPEYRKYTDILKFLSHVPSVWEKTIPLSAKIGEYLSVARKSGEEWYVGAMTNSTGREMEIDFSFLPEGTSYNAEIYRDNTFTAANAKEYTYEVVPVTNSSKIKYNLAPEGGVVIRLYSTTTGISGSNAQGTISVTSQSGHNQLEIMSPEPIRSVNIVDITGKIRYQGLNPGQSKPYRVNLSSFSHGIYIVQVITGNEVYSKKIFR